jgi:hypothetical protein
MFTVRNRWIKNYQRGISIILFLICFTNAPAQQCGNCKETPKLTTFDFDVQVPTPNVTDSTDQLWPEWKNLFIIAGAVASNLKKNEGNCITFTIPPAVDTGDVQLAKVGGETFTNLPSNPNISSKLSEYGNYLMTGTIKKSGDAVILHVEIQSSCERKTVATAAVSFQFSSVAGNVNSIAQQAASQLSPLIEKIKKFELEERQKNKKLSLYQTNWEEPIKITPQKRTLKSGESTDFTVELKDCDGIPVEGREILFSETTFEGFKIFGTTGGTVSPAKIVTDANGKATAKFTLKSGAKEAIISAHSPGMEVKGCKSMFTGDAAINIRRTYSGTIKYSFDQSQQCVKSFSDKVSTGISQWNHTFKVEYTGNFYSNDLGYNGDEEPIVMESGNMVVKQYEHKKITVANNPPTEQEIKKDQSGGLKSGTVRFGFDANAPFAELNLKFMLEGTSSFKQTYLPSASGPANEEFLHSVAFFHIDKNLQYKKTTEGGKIKHIITYIRTDNKECLQLVERMQLQVIEE